MKYKLAIISVAIVITSFGSIAISLSAHYLHNGEKQPINDPLGWMSLPETDKQPEGFEPFLDEHPDDFDHRTAALVWYSRRERNLEHLKQHTFAMIEHHPGSADIYFANVTPFYADLAYRDDVIARLEQQLKRGHTAGDIYFSLASICEQGALPRLFANDDERQRFLRYFELPEDTVLPTEVDRKLADKALKYYRLAIDTAQGVMKPLNAAQLVYLLSIFETPQAACEQADTLLKSIPELKQDANFLYTHGRLLVTVGQLEKAKRLLSQVQRHDHESFEGGPGHITMRTELLLGDIAFEAGDMAAAEQHLMAALDVQPCCHSITQGVSLSLAEKLLAAGKHKLVCDFCEKVLDKYIPEQPETIALLKRAQVGLDYSR